jgi:hypothetical protein
MTTSPSERARRNRSAGLEALVRRLTSPALRRQGFVRTEIISQWPSLVGPEFAAATQPEQLRFPPGARHGGTLTVRVAGARAPLFAYALEPLKERINALFGYAAIERIRLVQGPVASRRPPRWQRPAGPPPPLPDGLPPGPLRDALARLAETFADTVPPKSGDNPTR